MTRKLDLPSYWSGIAASAIPFEDVADYSRWACMLLERGYDGDGICALAGMQHESNLFVLRECHKKALADLGVAPPDAHEALSAHARGQMNSFWQDVSQRRSCFKSCGTSISIPGIRDWSPSIPCMVRGGIMKKRTGA